MIELLIRMIDTPAHPESAVFIVSDLEGAKSRPGLYGRYITGG